MGDPSLMENPIQMDDEWGYHHDLGNLHIGDVARQTTSELQLHFTWSYAEREAVVSHQKAAATQFWGQSHHDKWGCPKMGVPLNHLL